MAAARRPARRGTRGRRRSIFQRARQHFHTEHSEAFEYLVNHFSVEGEMDGQPHEAAGRCDGSCPAGLRGVLAVLPGASHAVSPPLVIAVHCKVSHHACFAIALRIASCFRQSSIKARWLFQPPYLLIGLARATAANLVASASN